MSMKASKRGGRNGLDATELRRAGIAARKARMAERAARYNAQAASSMMSELRSEAALILEERKPTPPSNGRGVPAVNATEVRVTARGTGSRAGSGTWSDVSVRDTVTTVRHKGKTFAAGTPATALRNLRPLVDIHATLGIVPEAVVTAADAAPIIGTAGYRSDRRGRRDRRTIAHAGSVPAPEAVSHWTARDTVATEQLYAQTEDELLAVYGAEPLRAPCLRYDPTAQAADGSMGVWAPWVPAPMGKRTAQPDDVVAYVHRDNPSDAELELLARELDKVDALRKQGSQDYASGV